MVLYVLVYRITKRMVFQPQPGLQILGQHHKHKNRRNLKWALD